MEIKHNDATRNRPDGPRVIDAPYLFADLKAYTEQVKDEKSWEKNDRNGITVFKSDDLTIVLTALKEGAVIKDNDVNGFFSIQVLEGNVRMETLEGDAEMQAGQIMVFHPCVPHSIEARKDSVLLLTNHDKDRHPNEIVI